MKRCFYFYCICLRRVNRKILAAISAKPVSIKPSVLSPSVCGNFSTAVSLPALGNSFAGTEIVGCSTLLSVSGCCTVGNSAFACSFSVFGFSFGISTKGFSGVVGSCGFGSSLPSFGFSSPLDFIADFLSKHRSIVAVDEIGNHELFDDIFVQKHTRVHALFIKSCSVAISHYVATSIDRELSGKLTLLPTLACDTEDIRNFIDRKEFDFIITDVLLPLPQPQCPVILIDTFLSTTTFTQIAKLTDKIKQQKEQIVIKQLPIVPYMQKSCYLLRHQLFLRV